MSRKVVYDSSDEGQVRAAEKDEADRDKDLQWILSSPRGRRWIYDLCYGKCHIERASFCGTDTHGTSFNEGGRAIGSALMDDVRTAYFGAFMKMMEENHDPIN
jgi:hypothetical protein|tara:strand:- start:4485 stop:4793 length:309 start_codon:yes stop_codon:yes gene_type:complete